MTETLANGYSYESAQQELSSEYQHDRVQMVIKNLCVIVLGMKVSFSIGRVKGHSGQKKPDSFDETLQAKAKIGKYLKEKCYSGHYQ